ncbi:MAG: hypothetical protein DRQ89_14445 [Epsilonproteobacteria bacterium]|nr:MAG: hypothetical protein DRQ89_14445 [Campylobacterota bacterium]
MNRSETQSKIAPALVKGLGTLMNPPMRGTNPHFKSKFAALADILDSTRGHLKNCGLVVMQDSSGSVLIMHESGEWVEFPGMPLTPSKSDPQGHVAALTYARRAYLTAALGICGDPDDDGNSASSSGGAAQNTTPCVNAPTGQQGGSDDMSTKNQQSCIYAKAKGLYPSDDMFGGFKRWMKAEWGTDHTGKLTMAQAKEVIDKLVYFEEHPE